MRAFPHDFDLSHKDGLKNGKVMSNVASSVEYTKVAKSLTSIKIRS